MNTEKKAIGRTKKLIKEKTVNLSVTVTLAQRDALNKWLSERGYKLATWVKHILKKETGIEL